MMAGEKTVYGVPSDLVLEFKEVMIERKSQITRSKQTMAAAAYKGVIFPITVANNVVITAEGADANFKLQLTKPDGSVVELSTHQVGEVEMSPEACAVTLQLNREAEDSGWTAYRIKCSTERQTRNLHWELKRRFLANNEGRSSSGCEDQDFKETSESD